jgi:hypothetical protein
VPVFKNLTKVTVMPSLQAFVRIDIGFGRSASFSRDLPFPDFLCIGARKAGTTWLHTNLSRHPEIWTPPLKEIHYFDQRIKEPTFGALVAKILRRQYTDDWYHYWFWPLLVRGCLRRHRKKFDTRRALWDLHFFVRSPSNEWYASLFRQARGKITGETTPDYCVLDEAAIAHIHQLMPAARIIFLMRNPIEQVYSSEVMGLDIRGQTIDEVTDGELLERFEDEKGKLHASYLKNLQRWRRFYPDDQIFIGFLEDIHFHPARLLRHLYRFLGVDGSYARHVIRRKSNTRSQQKMPTRLAAHLSRTYQEDLRHLSSRFGGYASFWLYCAQVLADEGYAEDSIPYPLWDSSLWNEWVETSRQTRHVRSSTGEVQSAPLERLAR